MNESILVEYPLPCSAADAFDLYVHRIGDWWPRGFTAHGDGLDTVTIEPTVGGRVYERGRDGSVFGWGVVQSYEPGSELVHSFHLAQDAQHPTEVAVRFTDALAGCHMRFEHRGWTMDNVHERAKFEFAGGGWDVVLGAFVELARS
ncbi:MAG TPA: SRPBCC domain-containing protein [Lysobacter sp.]